jgi:hypothetical protein
MIQDLFALGDDGGILLFWTAHLFGDFGTKQVHDFAMD